MTERPLNQVIRRTLSGLADTGALTDSQLLEQFVTCQSEAAFEGLVRRHGPMVLRVCQRVLGHSHDAEDAFQATFIVLARKAGAIAKRGSVGSWLYGAAYRIALKAKCTASRRHAQETQFDPESLEANLPAQANSDAALQALGPVLDEELSRLPEKYRAPVVICYLEGKTNVEAAQGLRCSTRTIERRLTDARELLRKRLARRGLALSVTGLGTQLALETAHAAVPLALWDSTVRGAALLAEGQAAGNAIISPQAITLADVALKAFARSRVKSWVVLLAIVAIVGTAIGGAVHWALAWRHDPTGLGQGDRADSSEDPLYAVWRFDNPPGNDLRVVRGQWNHFPGKPGAMGAPDTSVVLPTSIPRKPVVLTIKVRRSLIPGGHSSGNVAWTDGMTAAPCKIWDNSDAKTVIPLSLRCFFADRWMFEYFGSTLARVHEYAKPYPESHIAFVLQNLVIEEIELRGLQPEELPGEMQNPYRTIQDLKLKENAPPWMWLDSSGARSPVPVRQADPYHFVWQFDHGPSKDLRVVYGEWSHVPGSPGAMRMPDTALILAPEVPQRPVVLTMKIRSENQEQMTISAGWCKDQAHVPFSSWWRKTNVPTPWLVSCYYTDRWMFMYIGEHLYKVQKYQGPYPGKQIFFGLTNSVIDEIELSGLRPEELPHEMKDPERTIQTKGLIAKQLVE